MKKQNFKIAVTQSNIDWTGRKVTGSHFGTIAIKDGTLTTTDDTLTGGNFVVDTTSIKILDITDRDTNTQFAGHLASDDFFGISNYPEALFEITAVNNNHVDGNLTIKGITHPIGFDASVSINEDTLTASGDERDPGSHRISVEDADRRQRHDEPAAPGTDVGHLGDDLVA